METAEIEVFLVLAEELHFGRTAERLRLPQPRVSRLVASLEHQIGGSLFERTSFVGIERVTGTLGGRTGTFLLQDAGTVQGSIVSGEWFVIPGSGTGQLAGLRGEGGFRANLGEGAQVHLDYWFE